MQCMKVMRQSVTVARYYNEPLCSRDGVDFVKAHGLSMPSFPVAALAHSPKKIRYLVKKCAISANKRAKIP